jgi:hypothetical protein
MTLDFATYSLSFLVINDEVLYIYSILELYELMTKRRTEILCERSVHIKLENRSM